MSEMSKIKQFQKLSLAKKLNEVISESTIRSKILHMCIISFNNIAKLWFTAQQWSFNEPWTMNREVLRSLVETYSSPKTLHKDWVVELQDLWRRSIKHFNTVQSFSTWCPLRVHRSLFKYLWSFCGNHTLKG